MTGGEGKVKFDPLDVASGGRDRERYRRTPAELKEMIAAERTGNHFLVWFAGDGRQQLLLLEPDRWRVTIGRDPSADLPLVWDTRVSRTHALLERVGAEWTLVDDGLSRNGSSVNGKLVSGRCRLANGDRLTVGATEITYRAVVSPPGGQTVSPMVTVAQRPLSPMQRKVVSVLCRPVQEEPSSLPSTNREIADEVFLSVDAVKAHLRVLFDRYGLNELPQNAKRRRLVAAVLESGVLERREC